MPDEAWVSGSRYEPYVGRWSRLVAERFLTWLQPAAGAEWLDVGCGTAEMVRVCRAGGAVAAYVWDYAEGMQLIRLFWDAAAALDPAAAGLDEGCRFPLCRPDRLAELFAGAGLTEVTTTALTVPTRFVDFEDYWTPFLGGQGPAPGYCAGLPEDARRELRDRLRSAVPAAGDGSITLTAPAWAVRGTPTVTGRNRLIRRA